MKIAFIEPHLKVVGGIRRIIEVSNRLIGLGHELSIFTPVGTPCRWLVNNIPTYKLSHLHKYTFDVVIFNLAEQYGWANKANAKVKIFWVLAAEAEYKDPKIPIRALKQDFFFITNSSYTQRYIKKHRSNLSYDPPILPGGINPDHFKWDKDIPKDFHVLYFGSFRPWKGTTIIEGALHKSGLKLLKMEGLGTPQEKMYELYNKSTIFISAAQVEGFNFPILEAMACGCPVICTDDGGSRDFVRNNVNAMVIPRNRASIQNGVYRLLGDKKLRTKFRIEGLKTVSANRYRWDNVVKELETILITRLEA